MLGFDNIYLIRTHFFLWDFGNAFNIEGGEGCRGIIDSRVGEVRVGGLGRV